MEIDLKMNEKQAFSVGDIITSNSIDFYLIIEAGWYTAYPISLLDLYSCQIEQEYTDLNEIPSNYKLACRNNKYKIVEI